MRQSLTPNDVVDLLNELVAMDRVAVGALLSNRIPCNELVANHPTIPVQAQNGGFYVSFIGVVNGMFGVLPGTNLGPITYVMDDDGLVKFIETAETLEDSNYER